MKRIVDTSEILGITESPEGACEVCAEASGAYDESTHKLMVRLDAYLRPSGFGTKEKKLTAEWLPHTETITESVDRNEASDVTHDIFRRWTKKVCKAAPSLHAATY